MSKSDRQRKHKKEREARSKANQEAFAEAEKRGRGRPPMQGIARDAPSGGRRIGNAARPNAALRDALLARARLAGIAVERGKDGKERLTADLVVRLKQPWMGCNAGRAIEAPPVGTADKDWASERADLWGAISAVRRAYARYWRAIGLPDPYPPTARMLYAETPPPDGDEVAPPDTAWARDLLSVEEEVKAATGAMMMCEQRLGLARWLKGCILNDEQVRDRAVLIACLRGMV